MRGWIKLNVDGVCKNGRNSGCGGVSQNEKGEMIISFAKCLGSCIKANSFIAEL